MELMFGNSAVHNNACMQDANIKIITTSYETAKVTIVSSLLGIFGSLMIIISHVCWKDLRKSTARTILLFLALADFAASVGYLFSAIAYLVVFSAVASHPGTNLTDSVGTFSTFCWIEGIWDTYFPVVSFLWTTNLAIYFVVTLVCRRSRLAKNLMIIFHLTAWFIPMIVCIAGVASGWLHPSGNPNAIEDTVSAAWCFVSDWKVSNITNKQMFDNKIALYYVMEAICGKGIEVAAYFVVAGCYAVIICHNKCRCCLRRYIRNPLSTTSHLLGNNPSYQTNRRLNVSLVNMDIKLLFLLLVPLLFVCVRLPGTIRYFISFIHPGCRLPVYNRGDDGVCINKSCYDLLYNPVLVNFQAFCDPLQGFVNGILYLFFSKLIIQRMICCTKVALKRFCFYCLPTCSTREGYEGLDNNGDADSLTEADLMSSGGSMNKSQVRSADWGRFPSRWENGTLNNSSVHQTI